MMGPLVAGGVLLASWAYWWRVRSRRAELDTLPFRTVTDEGLPSSEACLLGFVGGAWIGGEYYSGGAMRLAIGPESVAIWLPKSGDWAAGAERFFRVSADRLLAPKAEIGHVEVVAMLPSPRIDFVSRCGGRCGISFYPSKVSFDELPEVLSKAGFDVTIRGSRLLRFLASEGPTRP